MDRETTKHGPSTDDRLAAESSGRSEPGGPTGLEEPAGDPELPGEEPPPVAGARPSPMDDPTVGAGERAVRRELLDRLQDASFPANRNALLRHLGADQRGQLAAHLRALPPDRVFGDAVAVVEAFGGIRSED